MLKEMLWRKKEKVEIKIKFDKKTSEIFVICKPSKTRPTEVIQILLLGINTINSALQSELQKKSKKKKINQSYIS